MGFVELRCGLPLWVGFEARWELILVKMWLGSGLGRMVGWCLWEDWKNGRPLDRARPD